VKCFLKKSQKGIYFPLLAEAEKIQSGKIRTFLSLVVPVFLQIAIFSTLIILLARPQISLEKEKINKKGVDLFFVLDVSGSMLAEDLTPNRIESAKNVLDSFLTRLEGDRAGIIIFSGFPFTQVPLTFDYPTLRKHLKNISTESISSRIGGTLIGDAILSAADKFPTEDKNKEGKIETDEKKDGEEVKKKDKEREKVIVLITDGEQSKKGLKPEIAAQYAKEKDIKIYCVGIGKPGGAPIIYTDEFGNKRTAKDIFGNVQYTKLDEKSLKNIANIANGKYFRATDDKTLEKIFTDIRKLTQKEIEVESYTEQKDIVFPFGILLLLLIPLEFFLRRSVFHVIR